MFTYFILQTIFLKLAAWNNEYTPKKILDPCQASIDQKGGNLNTRSREMRGNFVEGGGDVSKVPSGI